ncbi:MAG: lysine--tRNA ligase, partial [Alphaproteobacteria bacterium]|nr:lysine--tRNA ligase [Alphaproteobacteria bacterium]
GAAFEDLAGRFAALPADADGETFQTEVYAVGKEHGFEPLRAWFQALYEVLLGQSAGPRFGSFVALYGRDEMLALMREMLDKPQSGAA